MEESMKRGAAFLITFFILTTFTITAIAAGAVAFNRAKGTVKKNGIDTYG